MEMYWCTNLTGTCSIWSFDYLLLNLFSLLYWFSDRLYLSLLSLKWYSLLGFSKNFSGSLRWSFSFAGWSLGCEFLRSSFTSGCWLLLRGCSFLVTSLRSGFSCWLSRGGFGCWLSRSLACCSLTLIKNKYFRIKLLQENT